MDAKCDDVAFTPRQGKAVEINALWYHALMLMGEKRLAAKVAESFAQGVLDQPVPRAWPMSIDRAARARCDDPPEPDFRRQPAEQPADADQQTAVVEVVRRELLTPFGLRTLARERSAVTSDYTGAQFERDARVPQRHDLALADRRVSRAYLKVNNRSAAAIAQAKAGSRR